MVLSILPNIGGTLAAAVAITGTGKSLLDHGVSRQIDDAVDGATQDPVTRAFLKYLVNSGKEYAAILALSKDPKEAAIRLLTQKGVDLTRLLGAATDSEMLELSAEIAAFIAKLPAHVRLMGTGPVGLVSACGLIVNDAITVGNGSQYLQRKWYETFINNASYTIKPPPRNPAKGPQLLRM
jgi:hypothetical protein